MFTSAFILAFVIAALWQVSFAYCRTLLAINSELDLSSKTEKVMGLTVDTIPPHEFDRLMALVRVAPDPGDDAAEITAISLYYRVIRMVAANSRAAPISLPSHSFAAWFQLLSEFCLGESGLPYRLFSLSATPCCTIQAHIPASLLACPAIAMLSCLQR
jgi:hypothetical protein